MQGAIINSARSSIEYTFDATTSKLRSQVSFVPMHFRNANDKRQESIRARHSVSRHSLLKWEISFVDIQTFVSSLVVRG